MSTTKQFTVKNRYGIHVRPSGLAVKEMQKFPGVTFEIDAGDGFSSAMGIMDLMTFDLSEGKTATLKASGPNEAAACDAITQLLSSEFAFDR